MIAAAKPVNRISLVPPEPQEICYDIIHLADNEWNNDTMERIAREWFEQYPDCQFVEVREHGGWHLCWRRDMSLWGTANDRASLKPGSRPTGGVDRICRRQTGVTHSLQEM